MIPPKHTTQFEKVSIGEFINGEIELVEYDTEHKFVYKGQESIGQAVRFRFKLDGYKFPHYSRWMRFNVGEKANLYKTIISKLVANARPEMYFDLDVFNGFKVKTIWAENKDFQNLENIFPQGSKLQVNEIDPDEAQGEPVDTGEQQEGSW